MSRLGCDKQRDREGAERSPAPAVTPIDVRVPEAGPGARSASVDGSLVVAAPGEEIQNAVLDRLHRLALAAGRPVLATIHDERVGYSVPLRVDPDGSSHLAAEPVPTAPEKPAVRRDPPTVAAGESVPTFTLRALPEPAGGAAAPGTVAPPTGVFGPPPRMDGAPATGTSEGGGPVGNRGPVAVPKPTLTPEPVADLGLGHAADLDLKPVLTPTPARGFDAVAEAVLGDEPLTAPGDATAPSLLAEPTARINEAVKEGRTAVASQLAEQTVTEASKTLGAEHPEVLRLRELTAYIAYLSGEPDQAFRLSLDLVRIHRHAGDAEAAYGNVQSAATAWRAVRDPARGLELGNELVGLWDEIAAEEGPAAEDTEELESARTRMGRLTDRVRAQAG
ncbi:tetratricopeptide repeat protein [Streptomyces marokkonensis]|uniref:Tetratricopeptide repeat protein n=1 Tax=Streptomyces marokkonensis TaxID=324855 RepID=A0ABP7SI34_9ACTN